MENKIVIDKKIGRNENCVCGSGRKFKKCCITKVTLNRPILISKWSVGQENSSNRVTECIDFLKELYPEHLIIDLSDRLNETNYEIYQMKNFKDKVIMILERNPMNESVFSSREKRKDDVDMMVLYHGSYRCYDSIGFESAKNYLPNMIN
jgi:hypothetical protein